ncbi:MAG: cytochrome c biogenesis protein CcdA [Spirochaetota bacterium]
MPVFRPWPGSPEKPRTERLLLGAFSFGLGIPFPLAGSFFPAFLKQLGRVKPHFGTIRTASGLFLVGIGVLIALGRLQTLNGQLIRLGTDLARWHEANPGSSRILFAVLAAAIAAAPVLWGLRRRRARGDDAAILGRFGTVVTAVAGVTAVLQLAGVLDLALVFAEWFRFQGI